MSDTPIAWDDRRGIATFARYQLDARHLLFEGWLPDALVPASEAWEALWAAHPPFVADAIGSRAYGQRPPLPPHGEALPALDPRLEPFMTWARTEVDHRLNHAFVRWLDAALRHAVPRRREPRLGIVAATPVVLLSLGATRTFRLRPLQERGFRDFKARNGTIFILPAATTTAWTYEYPHHARHLGRTISITLRAFEDALPRGRTAPHS